MKQSQELSNFKSSDEDYFDSIFGFDNHALKYISVQFSAFWLPWCYVLHRIIVKICRKRHSWHIEQNGSFIRHTVY